MKLYHREQLLFTLDPLLQEREGVRHMNMVDFMASDGELA